MATPTMAARIDNLEKELRCALARNEQLAGVVYALTGRVCKLEEFETNATYDLNEIERELGMVFPPKKQPSEASDVLRTPGEDDDDDGDDEDDGMYDEALSDDGERLVRESRLIHEDDTEIHVSPRGDHYGVGGVADPKDFYVCPEEDAKCCSPKVSASDASPAAVVAEKPGPVLAVSQQQNKSKEQGEAPVDTEPTVEKKLSHEEVLEDLSGEGKDSETEDDESPLSTKQITARFTDFYDNAPKKKQSHYRTLLRNLKDNVFRGNDSDWIEEAVRTFHLAVLLDLNPTHALSLEYRKRLVRKLGDSVGFMTKGPYSLAYGEKNLNEFYFNNQDPHHELQRFMKEKDFKKLLEFIDPLPEKEDLQMTSPIVESSVAQAEEVHTQPQIEEKPAAPAKNVPDVTKAKNTEPSAKKQKEANAKSPSAGDASNDEADGNSERPRFERMIFHNADNVVSMGVLEPPQIMRPGKKEEVKAIKKRLLESSSKKRRSRKELTHKEKEEIRHYYNDLKSCSETLPATKRAKSESSGEASSGTNLAVGVTEWAQSL